MTLIQFILIASVLLITVATIRFLPGEKSLAVKRVLALLFVVAAVFAIMMPNMLTKVANLIGVGRGADLLLYVLVVVFLLFAASVIRAKARSDARVTHLAREVALLEARMTEAKDTTSEDSAE